MNSTFQIFIYDDEGNTYELDTEGIDYKDLTELKSYEDVASRTNPITTLKLKGTAKNNAAFGSWFDLSRTSNFNSTIGVGFNYNPLRPCNVIIYESNTVIFRGTLRINGVVYDNDRNMYYDVLVLSAYLDLKPILQDRTLSDLDFTNLKHRYSGVNIVYSWSIATERYNTSTSAFTSQPFEMGSGFIYPYIDYGYNYSASTATTEFHARNFRAAIYVQEYFDRIFSQDGVEGYSYEIKGSPTFKEMFKHLIVPDAQNGYLNNHTGFITTFSKPFVLVFSVTVDTFQAQPPISQFVNKLIPIPAVTLPPPDILPTRYLELYSTYNNVLAVRRGFKSAATVKISIRAVHDPVNDNYPIRYTVKLVKRIAANDNNAFGDWQSVGSKSFTLSLGQIFDDALQFNCDITQYNENEQVAVMVTTEFLSGNVYMRSQYEVFGCELIVPPTINDVITIDSQPSLTNSDVVIPAPPINVKQSDFLKSIVNQLNLFVYNDADNPKKIVFEKYDDFYTLCLPQNIQSNALDWSSKIDYNKGCKLLSNLSLPKSYLYTYTDDQDFFSTSYKALFNETYGSFGFADQFGLLPQKEIKLIFSPTILVSRGSDRIYPALYQQDDSGQKKLFKSNIRLMYYNGLHTCENWSFNNLETIGATSTWVEYFTGDSYPQCGNYYKRFDLLSGWTLDNDIHFGKPRQIYFFAGGNNYLDAPTSYDYYINEVTDITNQDVRFLEVQMRLDEIDRANLDLKVPIYIKNGWFNSSYYKVISVDYGGSDSLSTVVLQQIAF